MLLRAPPKNDNLSGLKQNCTIHEQRHVFQVKQVKFELPFGIIEAGSIAKPHLCPSCQTRPDGVPKVVEGDFLLQLITEVRPFWTRPHEAHLATKHVEKLWDFIQASFT